MELSGAGNAAESTLHWAKRSTLGKHTTLGKEGLNMQRARRSTLGKEGHTGQGRAQYIESTLHWARRNTLGKGEHTRQGGAHCAGKSTI